MTSDAETDPMSVLPIEFLSDQGGQRRGLPGIAQNLGAVANRSSETAADGSDWWEQAACRDYAYPDDFHPRKDESPNLALAVCRSCDVREQCLDYAVAHNITEGIWGALTPDQRKKVRRRRT